MRVSAFQHTCNCTFMHAEALYIYNTQVSVSQPCAQKKEPSSLSPVSPVHNPVATENVYAHLRAATARGLLMSRASIARKPAKLTSI
jgi:hypothetical protein